MILEIGKWTSKLSFMFAVLLLSAGPANAQEGAWADKLFSELSACGLRITNETRNGITDWIDSGGAHLEGEATNIPREERTEFIMAAMAAIISLDTGDGDFCYRYSNSRDVTTLSDIMLEHIASAVAAINGLYNEN